MSGGAIIYKVRFLDPDKDDKDATGPIELMVRQVEPSSFPGLLCLRELIFEPSDSRHAESAVLAERYRGTTAIHVPYHNVLVIEERRVDQPSDNADPPKLAILKDRDLPRSDDE